TRVLSGGRPRRLAGRTRLAASSIGMVLTLNEGTSTRSWSRASVAAWLRNSSPPRMSIGTADEDTERGWLRLPSTDTVSRSVALPCGAAASGEVPAPSGATACASTGGLATARAGAMTAWTAIANRALGNITRLLWSGFMLRLRINWWFSLGSPSGTDIRLVRCSITSKQARVGKPKNQSRVIFDNPRMQAELTSKRLITWHFPICTEQVRFIRQHRFDSHHHQNGAHHACE